MAAYENWCVEWDMPVTLHDGFDRDETATWGSTRAGRAYTNVGGAAASEYWVDGDRGVHTHSVVNDIHRSFIDVSGVDFDGYGDVTVPVVPTGGSITLWLAGRVTDVNSHYAAVLTIATSATATLTIFKRVDGTLSTVAAAVTIGTHTAGDTWRIHFQGIGSALRATAYKLGTGAGEPSTWALSGTDLALMSGTQAGVLSRMETGYSLGTTSVYWDNLLFTVPEQWVDVTVDVDTIASPIQSTDGQNRETSDAAGSLSIVLSNIDGRYTPGNRQSVYYPNIAAGRRMRVTERIGTERFDIITGRLEWPEVDDWVQASPSAPREQAITLTAIDLLTQLDNAGEFVSTLTEHIQHHGGTALVRHWPFNDATTPWLPLIGDEPFQTGPESLSWGEPTAQSGTARVTPAGSDGPPGEDVQFPTYEMYVGTVSGFQRPLRYMVSSVNFPTGLTVAAGQAMTIVFWVRRSSVEITAEVLHLLVRYFATPTDGVIGLMSQDGDHTWLLDVTGATTASFVGPVAPSERWTAVAVRYGFSPNTIELWTDTVQTVGTLSFTPGSDVRVDDIYLPEGRFAGSFAHLQVYIGAPEDWTFADFTEQRRVGLEGYERQTTGERIRTVLAFAGVAAGQMGEIDDGTTVMQRVTLAGRTPGDVIAEAVDTELGDFHANGRGEPAFWDRRRLYNI